MSPIAAREMLVAFLFCVEGFYWWSTSAIRRRYGSIKAARAEALRMLHHPIMAILLCVLIAAPLFRRLFAAGPSLAGAVWLSLSIFDFLLLRRIVAEIAADPPTTAPQAVVRYG